MIPCERHRNPGHPEDGEWMGSGNDSGMRLGLGSILRDTGCSEQKDQEGRDCVNRASVPLKPQALVELGER